MTQSLIDLWYGFGVALEPYNLLWCLFGVVVGNLIGVLPGMGPLSAISILLPLTYSMHAVAAIMMLAGIFYGSQYGGAIGAILLNLPCHPSHAVTCLDGYPMTKQKRGGTALGIAMISSFFAASCGILLMIFASPLLVEVAFRLGPAELFAIMLLGLVAGGSMARGSKLKGISMTLFGLLVGMVGTDLNTGAMRFTFGIPRLEDGVEIVALALGVFGVADFLRSVNRTESAHEYANVRLRDMWPRLSELKQAFLPMVRGTFVGSLFGGMPGTGSTITTFVAYAVEQRVARNPGKFGTGALEGVAAPEAAAHSKTQVDFIPTMTLGIPGDAVMALILGALMIQGIDPGPQLITEHADLFWGLIASFWVGNVLLMILNAPMIGIWVKCLQMPYRFLFPSALFFIAIGIYSTNNSLFEVAEVLAFGIAGAILLALEFPMAPILLGFVLGPLVEENFRRAMLLSRGDLMVFVERPISAIFIAACALLLAGQLGVALWSFVSKRKGALQLLRARVPQPQAAPEAVVDSEPAAE
ncbi:MAG TPA: tripartite tricarboxylate transporter permease [Dongiaceae bacterium]|jgi:TctA family transporter|nr:tripartite tricarboxylate transporter permease [Dongiaceae bacterium]